jgi:uncharacterized membrane protein YphA (DoxX/SURF4 family)
MIQAETFVGSLAIVMAIAIGATALGPIQSMPMLRLVRTVKDKFGDAAARLFLVVIAVLLLTAGVMILKDFRPKFAAPLSEINGIDRDSTSE